MELNMPDASKFSLVFADNTNRTVRNVSSNKQNSLTVLLNVVVLSNLNGDDDVDKCWYSVPAFNRDHEPRCCRDKLYCLVQHRNLLQFYTSFMGVKILIAHPKD